ncbi:MAG: PilZ domain-containing protein [Desulfuromonadaceae bacterium]|nr:PilZ domain-containing protein [Desulfuromonadaceae bacterium]
MQTPVADAVRIPSATLAAKMSPLSHNSDYSRYFKLRQKVYLVNMSAERNRMVYESLSGVVTSSGTDSLEIMVTHGGEDMHGDGVGVATYKLTSEALGSGIQVLAELTGITAGTVYRFRTHGTLEMFQRRDVTRVELSAPIFQLRGNFPLAFFKKEWMRVIDHLHNSGVLPGLVLQETQINLSVGGIGLTVDTNSRPTPLSMFFISLDEGLPVCALAEALWERGLDEGLLRCGFRFIHILKSDQERINNCASDLIRKSGGTHLDYTRNCVLMDKMVADGRKP